jgi:hypothetical protein
VRTLRITIYTCVTRVTTIPSSGGGVCTLDTSTCLNIAATLHANAAMLRSTAPLRLAAPLRICWQVGSHLVTARLSFWDCPLVPLLDPHLACGPMV